MYEPAVGQRREGARINEGIPRVGKGSRLRPGLPAVSGAGDEVGLVLVLTIHRYKRALLADTQGRMDVAADITADAHGRRLLAVVSEHGRSNEEDDHHGRQVTFHG